MNKFYFIKTLSILILITINGLVLISCKDDPPIIEKKTKILSNYKIKPAWVNPDQPRTLSTHSYIYIFGYASQPVNYIQTAKKNNLFHLKQSISERATQRYQVLNEQGLHDIYQNCINKYNEYIYEEMLNRFYKFMNVYWIQNMVSNGLIDELIYNTTTVLQLKKETLFLHEKRLIDFQINQYNTNEPVVIILSQIMNQIKLEDNAITSPLLETIDRSFNQTQ